MLGQSLYFFQLTCLSFHLLFVSFWYLRLARTSSFIHMLACDHEKTLPISLLPSLVLCSLLAYPTAPLPGDMALQAGCSGVLQVLGGRNGNNFMLLREQIKKILNLRCLHKRVLGHVEVQGVWGASALGGDVGDARAVGSDCGTAVGL